MAWYLYRRPPQTAAQVCNVGGVVMAVIILLAPATRIGYLLYPINFFVWAYLFRRTAGDRGAIGARERARRLSAGDRARGRCPLSPGRRLRPGTIAPR